MNTQLSIGWAPLLEQNLLIALGVVAALGVVLAIWRRAPGAWWRLLGLGVLLLTLANPSLIEELRDPLDDVVMVVVDESPSQNFEPREEQREEALQHVTEALESLGNTEVQVLRGGTSTFSQEDQGTRLFETLRDGLSAVPRQRVAGVILLTDGQVHDVPESLETLGIDAPVHVFLNGLEDEADRRIVVTQAPSFGIVGREQSLKLRVDDLPESGHSELVRVEIRQDGGEPQVLAVPTGEEQEFEFELTHRGPTVIELEVEPAEEELTTLNNRTAIVVNGVRERLRVLLVSGEPHAGERAWRNILKSDPSVDLVHFTILRPPEKQDGTPIRELSLIAFPTRELFEVKLDEFDLIIFDRYRRRNVLPIVYLDNIANYVDQGGALLEAVGPTFATPLSLYRTPLGRVLPGEPSGRIYEQGYQPKVTDIGQRHPVTADLPGAEAGENGEPDWGRWFRLIDADSTSGVVTMTGVEDRPLLILDRVGEGRVAQLMSDQMWLWARGFEGGGPQAEMLRRIAHWLMQEPDLEEEDLRAVVKGGRLVVTRRSLGDDLPPIEVTLPSGNSETLTLEPGRSGRAQASMTAEESGLYRVTDGQRTALAAAGPLNPLEFEDLRSTDARLAPIVVESGGGFVRMASDDLPRLRKVQPERDRHGRGWLGIQENGRYVVTGVTQIPLMPAVLILFLALGATVLAWWREGR